MQYSDVVAKLQDDTETEIDIRSPRDFESWKTYSVRQKNFKYMTRSDPDGKTDTYDIGNWELFAHGYWYETRIKNTTCPMLPAGVAAACDWAMMVPCLFTGPGDLMKMTDSQAKGETAWWTPPSTIFVHHFMLSHFCESLSFYEGRLPPDIRFVLVIGGTDQTVPLNNRDTRFKTLRGFGGPDGGEYWKHLVANPHVAHVFMENHDIEHPKLSTLPTGMIFKDADDNLIADDRHGYPARDTVKPILDRPMGVLVKDRLRAGPQWTERWNAHNMCLEAPATEWCVAPDDALEITHPTFLRMVADAPFVACTHGGGIDPSPKAWESMLVGSIPIIRRGMIDDAYAKFPVVFIDSWEEFFKSENTSLVLQEWRIKLAPYYEEGSELRQKTLERLTTQYWTGLFQRRLKEYVDKEKRVGAGR